MPAKKLYLESLRVGDELPALVKPPIDRTQIARYAGASNDFSTMHVDELAARAAGMPSVFAHAPMPMAFMSQFLTEWLRGGRLSRLAVRFVKLVWPGDEISCKGRVLSRRRDEQGRYFVDVDIWAENQRGELILKGHGCGQIFYSAEDEARQKRGESPLIVDVSEENDAARALKSRPVKASRQATSSARKAGPEKPAARPAKAVRPKASSTARSGKK